MKATINTNKETAPGFLYWVMEIKGNQIILGWNGRRGFWNETGWMPLNEVSLFEDDGSPYLSEVKNCSFRRAE